MCFKNFWKVKNFKILNKIQTHDLQILSEPTGLCCCVRDNYGKETIYNITFDFIVNLNK